MQLLKHLPKFQHADVFAEGFLTLPLKGWHVALDTFFDSFKVLVPEPGANFQMGTGCKLPRQQLKHVGSCMGCKDSTSMLPLTAR